MAAPSLKQFEALLNADPEAAAKLLRGVLEKKFVPHDGQRPVMDSKARFKLMCAGRRFGKLLRLDQPIPSPNGFVAAGLIKAGDQVFGRHGKPTRVLQTFNHTQRPMYRLTFSDGAQIECCEDHLWEVKDKNGRKARVLDTKTIARTYIKLRSDGKREHRWKLARGKPVQYQEQDLPLPPYVVGALLGDGCLTHGIRLCANESDIAARFRAEGMDLSDPTIRKNVGGGTTVSYGIRGITAKLRSLGLHGHGFATKFVPKQYLLGSIEQRLDLLHGLMDTDGSIVRGRDGTGCMGEFGVGSEQLAKDCQELVRSLGGWASITERVTASGNPGWRVHCKLPLGLNLFWLRRKADLYRPRREPTRAIINVEKCGSSDGVCFEVEDEAALYYAGHEYILTHNTKIAAALGHRKARKSNQMVWWVAPTYKIVKRGYAEVLRQLPPGVLARAAPPESSFDGGRSVVLRFKNGSRWEFYSAERPEGMLGEGVDLVIMDEAAIMQEHIWTQVVRPTLADRGGEALFISTPRGRNWFYKMYTRGQDKEYGDYESWRFPSMANPYIPVEEWQEMEQTLPRAIYEQEILADFISNAASVFRFTDEAVIPLEAPKGHVVLGIDLAKHNDFTVLCGINSGNRHPCYHERFNTVSWPEQRRRIHSAISKLEDNGATGITVMVDSTGVGDVVYDDLSLEGLDAVPIKFTPQWKQMAVMLLAADLERDMAFLHHEQVSEFESYSYEITEAGRWKFEAASGHDDEVSAMLLAHWGVVNTGVPNLQVLSAGTLGIASADDDVIEGTLASEELVESVDSFDADTVRAVLLGPSHQELLVKGYF